MKLKKSKKRNLKTWLILIGMLLLAVSVGGLFLGYRAGGISGIRKWATGIHRWRIESGSWSIGSGGAAGGNRDADGELIAGDTNFEGLKLTLLDVGQGLCLYVEADGHAMIYDGGGRDSSSEVVSFVSRQDCPNLDYVIASHYDEDHIAGLVGCLKKFQVSQVLCPDYQTDTEIYRSFTTAATENGAQVLHPRQGQRFRLGNAKITVLGPKAYDSEAENNNSVAIRVVYGKFSFVVTGDAEAEEEQEILDSGLNLDSDLLIVGHHGSDTSNSEAMIAAISPTDAYISCGTGNDYGHPQVRTIAALEKYGVNIYRTDKQQEIVCSSDGYSYEEAEEPCADHSDGNRYFLDLAEEQSGTEDEGTGPRSGINQYVVNKSSCLFHYPDCSAVEKMSTRNRMEVECTRDELIAEGYAPCGNCHP